MKNLDNLETDFIALFKELLQKKDIKIEADKTMLYYLNMLIEYCPDLVDELVYISNTFSNDDLDEEEKLSLLKKLYNILKSNSTVF